MYLVKTPKFIRNFFPNFTWKIPTKENILYLTFDDGPVPEITPWVLDELDKYNARATFFCVGQNVEKNPELFKQVKAKGHSVGNHTYSHMNGWGADNIPYFHNVRRCASLVKSELFRPPYGKLMPKQIQFLQRHYNIVMWDVLSGDFDPNITAGQCFNNVIKNAGPGSIVVFHDSEKAGKNLSNVLPKVLETFAQQGYRFESLTPEVINKRQPLRKSA